MTQPKPKKKRAPARQAPPKSKGGADKQTLYRPEYDDIVRNLVTINGSTISEIAEILSVSVATIYNWQARHPSFADAIKVPQTIANQRVELSHYNECVGYFVEEIETRVIDGKESTVKRKVWQRPNTTAIIWWEKVKGGWQPPETLPAPPLGGDDGPQDTTIGRESEKQVARRIAFALIQGDKGKVA